MKNTGLVFVYGTLKLGGFYADQFDDFRIDSIKGYIEGDLYDLGNFPGILLSGKNKIYGELHRYSDFSSVVERMDRIEGYHEEDHPDNFYERKTVEVTTETGEIMEAVAYSLASKQLLDYVEEKGDSIKVENGVWEI